MPDAVISAMSVIAVAVVGYLGSRFVAKQTRAVGQAEIEVDQRKVDQEAFDRFISRYERDRERDQNIITDTRRLLRSAVRHINLLRGEMRRSNLDPPPLPNDLLELPWDMLDDGQPPGQSPVS
jgi:hypothetical protein